MTAVAILAAAWLLASAAVGVVLGRAISTADRDRERAAAMRRHPQVKPAPRRRRRAERAA